MSTTPSSAPSPSTSKSEYYSSLPWFRRLLATLNWRPVVDYELREIEFERSEREYEQRKIAHELRMERLRSENKRLAELNAKLSEISSSSATNSTQAKPTPSESET
jgi:hypothetical protein